MNRLLRRQRAVLALLIAFFVAFVGYASADPQSSPGQPQRTLELSPFDGQNLADTQALTATGTGFAANSTVILTEEAPLVTMVTAATDTLATATADSSGTFTKTLTVTRTFVDVIAGAGTVDCAILQCYVVATGPSTGNKARHTITFGAPPTTTTSTTVPPTTTTTSTTVPPTTTTSTTVPPATTTTSTTVPPATTTTSTTVPPATTTTSTTSTTVPPTTTTTTTVPPTTTTTVAGPTTTTTPPPTTTTLPGATTTTVSSQCAGLRSARASFNAQITAVEASLTQVLSAGQRGPITAQLEAIRAAGNAQVDALLAGC